MLRRAGRLLLAPRRTAGGPSLTPHDIFEQVTSGATVPVLTLRHFITRYFAEQAMRRGLSEARIHALDGRSLQQLLRSMMFETYVAVPFSVFAFDLEFTGLPGETVGPPSIIEIAIYSPDTNKSFSSLVRPLPGSELSDDAARLTGIGVADLDAAPHFDRVWRDALDFMAVNSESIEARDRTLMLSHGGRIADTKLLNTHCQHYGLQMANNIKFGDTHTVVKDLHRRRPVTADKHPPSWALSDLGIWLGLPPPSESHRALPDAKLTWDVLFNTLDRYGEAGLTPRQQLVARYYAADGEARIRGLHDGSTEHPPARTSPRRSAAAAGTAAAAGAVGGRAAYGEASSPAVGAGDLGDGGDGDFYDMAEDDDGGDAFDA